MQLLAAVPDGREELFVIDDAQSGERRATGQRVAAECRVLRLAAQIRAPRARPCLARHERRADGHHAATESFREKEDSVVLGSTRERERAAPSHSTLYFIDDEVQSGRGRCGTLTF